MEDRRGRTKSRRDHPKNGSKKKAARGRPTVIESLSDPHLPLKAHALRDLGRSWSEIGHLLGVSRTTSKRLATMYQKENESHMDGAPKNTVHKKNDAKHRTEDNQCPELTIDKEFLEYLPKTFKAFVSLVKQARETQ